MAVWTLTGCVLEGGGDEVSVGPAPPVSPDPTKPYEIWFDTSTDPGTLFAFVDGAWQQVTQREVFVDDEDPLTRDPPSPEAELWYDLSDPNRHVLKANVSGVWETVKADALPMPDEVVISVTPPTDPNNSVWIDTSSDPAVFMYKDPDTGRWVALTGGGVPPFVPDEVLVSEVEPRDQMTELWYDTNATASTTRSLELLDSVLNEIGLLRQSIATQESRLTLLETYVRNR